jgi:hypothetical protein
VYHVTARGNEQKAIYADDTDRRVRIRACVRQVPRIDPVVPRAIASPEYGCIEGANRVAASRPKGLAMVFAWEIRHRQAAKTPLDAATRAGPATLRLPCRNSRSCFSPCCLGMNRGDRMG